MMLSTTNSLTLANWTHNMSRSLLRQMLAIVARPGVLSFAGGLPAPELFPTEPYKQAVAHVLSHDAKALQYGPPFQPLKEHIVQLMAKRGVTCTTEQIFITTGAQQGIDILTRLLLNPGGEVMHEDIIYTGFKQAVSPYQPKHLTLATDMDTGLDVDAVEEWLVNGAKPAFLYTIPTAHNPLGVSLSQEKQQKLIHIAQQYNLPIIEDDPYGFLQYDGHMRPPLRALDDSWVFYLGSFSKILAPALRLGWMIVPESLVSKLKVVKEMGDLESSALTQRAISAYLDTDHFPKHLATLQQTYGARRDAMLQALQDHFPTHARWTHPDAGMFIWVTLADGIDTGALLETAVNQYKVAYVPGHAFGMHTDHARNCLRLNFSNCSVEQIKEGMQKLGTFFKQHS